MESRWRSLAREPLVHFLVAGLLLFLVLGRSDAVDSGSRTIIVDEDRIARLSANWERIWQRPPTAEELDRAIEAHVREEIYYREALRLSLDQDDIVIRRRLRSKMEFLARATAESESPDEAVLRQWLEDHAALYAPDAITSFDQVYLGEDGEADDVLRRLRQGGDPAALGAPISLPPSMADASRSEIERRFGAAFARAIDLERIGEWQGPVRSGFGRHLIRVTAHETGDPPALADVRQRVENDWRAATLAEREEQAYALLRTRYSVEVADVD
ncbi:peptidyl-prolyl cis-trans isomerase [Parasphingopyxis algicola]|uniref:peptidylprolyl isomerase n=1 Tax=Parasphingopyxis algicola TaxID=2026624 RepID=UPI0015A2B2C0|nr:peptidylprolyl isomerase [Parasphingopyxis algicola]QLC26032.1 peptidyl-prolyl cis-trans isomerase [Parasphingopyxis algicola]